MSRKFTRLILIFSIFGWFIFLFLAPKVEATPAATPPATEFIEKVDQTGGQPLSVLKQSETLIVGRPDETTLYDVSTVTAPVEVGLIPNFTALARSGTYLYGNVSGSASQWAVWDITQPPTPIQVSTFQPEGALLAHSEELLIFGDGNPYVPGIVIYSLSSPAAPQRVGDWAGLGVLHAILVGSRLYATTFSYDCDHGLCDTNPSSLFILDLSNPADPTTIGYGPPELSNYGRFSNLIEDGYLYQASPNFGGPDVFISEISQSPAAVTPVFTITLDGFGVQDITVYSDTLYVTNGSATKIFDVTNPEAPQELVTVNEAVTGPVYDQMLFGLSRATIIPYTIPYVPIYDLATPATPTLVHTIFHAAGDWMLEGSDNKSYIVDTNGTPSNPIAYLHTIDRTIPTAPRLVRTDRLNDGIEGSSPIAFDIVQEEYLYVTHFAYYGGGGGVDIYRLPTESTPLTFVRSLNTAIWQTMATDNAFLVQVNSSDQVLDVYDTTNPENPVLAAHLTVEYEGYAELLGEGNYVYLGELDGANVMEGRIFILDVANPAMPRVASVFEAGFFVSYNVSNIEWAVANGYLYYRHQDGLAIADVRDAANPQWTVMPTIPLDFHFAQFYVAGQRLYIVEHPCNNRLWVYSLNNPIRPRLSSYEETLEECNQGAKPYLPGGENFYIVNDYRGLWTYGFIGGESQFLPMLHRSP